MINIYLFDWGDTLMIDFPNVNGKMCDWEVVEAVSGAEQMLKVLSKQAKIYIATGADDSAETDIEQAFNRVGLSQYISGYFCKDNLGVSKGTPEFFSAILAKLNESAENIAMVGDNLEKDIKPALAVGIQAIWLTKNSTVSTLRNIKTINQLSELYR